MHQQNAQTPVVTCKMYALVELTCKYTSSKSLPSVSISGTSSFIDWGARGWNEFHGRVTFSGQSCCGGSPTILQTNMEIFCYYITVDPHLSEHLCSHAHSPDNWTSGYASHFSYTCI